MEIYIMKIMSIILLVFILVSLLSTIPTQAANPADIYPDNKVDWLDLKMMKENWLSTDSTPADIDNSGDVNAVDFAILANNWGWLAPSLPDDMLLIPGGEFLMGDHFNEGDLDELPVHAVYVDSFYISRYETTNQQYCDYLNSVISEDLIEVRSGIIYASPGGTSPYCDTYSYDADSSIEYSGDVFSVRIKDGIDMSDHPIVEVSWFGAIAYCNYSGYRLPSEAEWEYAARGGIYDPYYRYPWSDSIDVSMANFWDSGDPYETGSYPWTTPTGYYDGSQIPAGTDMANGYGLYDIAGNVSEWCDDWYDSNYYNVSPYDNPEGPASGTYRVLRGGCWYCSSTFSRVAYRNYYSQDGRSYHVGFRVVSDLE
jgi:formylglycine-generating enzyme required for sulfatase activity